MKKLWFFLLLALLAASQAQGRDGHELKGCTALNGDIVIAGNKTN